MHSIVRKYELYIALKRFDRIKRGGILVTIDGVLYNVNSDIP